MAIAVVGGMTTSTLLTLVIVPVIYLIVERVRGILKRGIRGSQG
jgi:HAE1 family hydrophobic/amphiphilic exporter-1